MTFAPIIGLGSFCLLHWSTMWEDWRRFWSGIVCLPSPSILILLLPSESAIDHKIGLCDCLRIFCGTIAVMRIATSEWQSTRDSFCTPISSFSMLHSSKTPHTTAFLSTGMIFFIEAYAIEGAWSNLPNFSLRWFFIKELYISINNKRLKNIKEINR